MKTLFEVTEENFPEFVDVLTENELVNEIKGRNEEGGFLIEVYCYRDDMEALQTLMELSEPGDGEED